ncbi:MAG: thiamine pyrophosphate-dependent enzyme [Longimicrobiales bacterium]
MSAASESVMPAHPAPSTSKLHRREVVAALLAGRGELLVVAGLGASAWDCAAAGDHPLTFSFWGGMGLAAVTGLGLALARPDRRVLVVTGDGEMLMGLGSLAAVAVQAPANLSIVVLDNERYGETGMQPTHTAHGVDLAGVAKACGFPSVSTLREADGLVGLREAVRHGAGPLFAVVKVEAEKPPLVVPPRDGALLKNRFRDALAGAPGPSSHP